ncbi:MAG TPA: F0F1 ATP synthase subunit delta [Gammaproteobacteria bacterium]|nr:F0F1 ATP synthase subunit delta [Gammaproteobacteria bacterium]
MADVGTIARPYAKALFDIASGEGRLGEWSQALSAASAVLEDANAKRVLGNPTIDVAKRAEFLRAVSVGIKGASVLETSQGKALLAVLAENDRLALVPEIAAQFDALKAQAENKVKVTMTAATQVDPGTAEQVKQALKKRLGREVELELAVDPSLIGGAVIRAEDMVIDGSVRARLEKLAAQLID